MPKKSPLVAIIDGSVDVTGAFNAIRRQAALLRDEARFILFLPDSNTISAADLLEFEHVERIRLPVIHRSICGIARYPLATLVAALKLARRLRELGCERLQVNDFYLLPAMATRLFGFRGRIITWVRINPRRFGLAGKLWLRAAATASDEIVSVSRYIGQCLPPALATRLIYEPASSSSSGHSNDRMPQSMLFVGNYIHGKGQEEAIAAFHRVAERFEAASLQFYGGDMGLDKNRAYLADLQRQATHGPGAGRIHFGEFLADPAQARAKAGIALNFSHSESFSLTCQEASSSALPVIATRCGGPEEIVHDGVTGLLVPVGNIPAMAEAMAKLLGDPKLAEAMGEAGRQLVTERFSPTTIRKSLVEVLRLGSAAHRLE